MTREQAHRVATEIQVAGVSDAYVQGRYVLDETGRSVEIYVVVAKIVDARRGNAAYREFREVAEVTTGAKVAKDMQREIRARAKGTRSRIAAERSAT